MICLHRILKCRSLPAFPNQETNVPDETIRGTQIILCPLQHQPILLQDQSVAVNDLAGESLVGEKDATVCLSGL